MIARPAWWPWRRSPPVEDDISADEPVVEVYVKVLEASIDCWRPTMAENLGEGLYRLLPTPGYDPEDEVWEFLPGTVVRLKKSQLGHSKKTMKPALIAIAA